MRSFFVLLAAGFLLGGPAWAETVELVTYYPTSSNSGNLSGDTLAIGYPGTTPANGTAIILGPVGIGTATPATVLDVQGISPTLTLRAPAAAQDITYDFRSGINQRALVRYTTGLNTLDLLSDTDVRVGSIDFPNNGIRVLRAGNVGIGTVAPQAPLQVGASSLFVQNDQGGNIELGGNATIANPVVGGMPYIDFHFGVTDAGGAPVAQDFNTRLINRADGILDVQTSTGGAAAQTRLSIGNNIGVGTITPQTTSPTGGATTGNLDANDVFIRSTGRWASQVGGGSRPDVTGTYTGNGLADRFINTGFPPGHVMIWQRHTPGNNHVHTIELWAGMPLVNAAGINEVDGFAFVWSGAAMSNGSDVRNARLRIVAGQNGFRVGWVNDPAVDSQDQANFNGEVYRWMAWR